MWIWRIIGNPNVIGVFNSNVNICALNAVIAYNEYYLEDKTYPSFIVTYLPNFNPIYTVYPAIAYAFFYPFLNKDSTFEGTFKGIIVQLSFICKYPP